MSTETNIHNYFFSHMRRGIATQIGQPDTSLKRTTVDVAIDAKRNNGEKQTVTKTIALYGPGDVLGFNESIIAKTEPEARVSEFNASLIPYIEFAEPDFLWRYSNLNSVKIKKSDGTVEIKDNQYWIPWLSLIVLKDDEFTFDSGSNPELPSVIRLGENYVLPDLNTSWRWAHIHIAEEEGMGPAALHYILQNAPHKAVCRLMCPRRLEANTNYTAFVVPTYKLGLEAALGKELAATLGELAWEVNANGKIASSQIPYYYNWTFRTGAGGDFELLADRLRANQIEGVGKRDIDCSNPGYGMKTGQRIMEMEAALQSFGMEPQKWGMDSTPFPNSTQTKLGDLLNSEKFIDENDDEKLRVVPPIYGRWYVSEEGADYDLKMQKNQGDKWVEELNLDFRHRIAAGLGVQFVKDNQEALMENAWNQLAEIRKANQAINLGKFGAAVSGCLHKRILPDNSNNGGQNRGMAPSASATTLNRRLRLALTMRTKLTAGSGNKSKNRGAVTIDAELSKPEVTLNHFAVNLKTQKYLRKRRPLKHKTINEEQRAFSNEKDYLVPPTFTVHGLVGVDVPKVPPGIPDKDKIEETRQQIADMTQSIPELLQPARVISKRLEDRLAPFRERERKTNPYLKPKTRQRGAMVVNGDSDPEINFKDIIWYPEFHVPMYRYLRDKSQDLLAPGLGTVPQNTVSLLQTNTRFIESFMMGLNHEFAAELRWREFPTDMRGSYFRKFWDTSIYSVDNDEKVLFAQSDIGQELLEKVSAKYSNYKTMEDIEEVFETPGNLGETEKAIALAYEIAVEKWLLTRDEDKDIKHPVEWLSNERLGENANVSNAQDSGGTDDTGDDDSAENNQTVLLIRGELLQAYPNVSIYLVKKTVNEDNKTVPDFDDLTGYRYAIFEGNLPPDVLFLGFNVAVADASEYFAVFQEPLDEVKYGLDESDGAANPNADLDDTSWKHFKKPSGAVISEGDYLNDLYPENAKMSDQSPTFNWNNPNMIAKVFTQYSVRLIIPLEDLMP